MNNKVKKLYQMIILSGIFILLITLVIAQPIISNYTDFCIYNTNWNGCSNIGIYTYSTGKFKSTIIFNTTELKPVQKSFVFYDLDASNSTIIIIGPQSNFTDLESDYIISFLNQGGLLFIADDFGAGNNLLSQLNATSRFSHNLLLDLSFEKNASFVAIFDIYNRTHPITTNISSLLLNYPSSIIPGNNTISLIRSSQVSWLDENINGKEDFDEPHGPFIILTIEPYGKGEIVLFSGPSLFINSMDNQFNNEKFKNQLFNYLLLNRETVIIDEYHREVALPFQMAYDFSLMIEPWFKILILFLLIFFYFILFTEIPKQITEKILSGLPKSKETSSIQNIISLIDEVMKKHPNWKRYKLEKIVERIENYDEKKIS